MTVGEYARSLVDQNYSQTEMYDMVLAFKAKQKKEKKTEVVAEQVKNTDSTPQDPNVESENNTGSESESGQSQPQELEVITDKKQALNAKPGQVYSDHGYEYKYEVGEDGKGEYYTKKPDDNDWIKAKGVAEASIASQFGHSDFDKESYFKAKYARQEREEALKLANAKQLEEAKKLQEQIDKQAPLVNEVESEVAYVNTVDKWKQREDIKADKNKTRRNTSTEDELKRGIIRGEDVLGDGTLDLDDFNGDEKQFEDYKKYKDITNRLAVNKNYKGQWGSGRKRITRKNGESIEELKARLKKEGRDPVKGKSSVGEYIVADMPGKLSKEEWTKLNEERKKLETSFDEGKFDLAEEAWYVKAYDAFMGNPEDRIQKVKAVDLVPTVEAVTAFDKKYIQPQEDGDNTEGINFAEITDEALLATKLDQAIQNEVTADPLVRKLQLEAEVRIKPVMAKHQEELYKKHDTDTPEGVAAFNKESEEIYSQLMSEDLSSNDDYSNRVKQIAAVGNKAFQTANNAFNRDNSWLGYLDDAQEAVDGLGPVEFWTDLVTDSAEGFAKGSRSIGTGIDKMQASYDVARAKQAKDKLTDLDNLQKSGALKGDSEILYYGKKMTVDEARKELKLEEKDWTKALESNLDEIKLSDEILQKYQTADLSDGDISWKDIVLTTSEALPQIGLATAGAAAGVATGGAAIAPLLGALGTVTMGVTMYGDAYMDAAETGAQEDYDAINGAGSYNQLEDKERTEFLITGLKSGRYHEPGKAALVAAVQTGMEKIGAGKILAKTQKALGVGKNGLASIIAGDLKSSLKNIGAGVLSKLEAGGTEFITEWGQEIVGGIGKGMMVKGSGSQGAMRYVDMGAAYEAGKAGGIVGIAIPFGGSIAKQSSIEVRNIARNVAINFAPSSNFGKSAKANAEFFKNAQNQLDKRLKSGKNPDGTTYTKEQHQEDSINLANIKNAGDKIPSAVTDPQTRGKMLDLLVKRDNLERKIKDIDDSDLTAEEDAELQETKQELREIMKQEALFSTNNNVRAAIEKSGKGNIEFQDFSNAKEMNDYAKQKKINGWQEKNSANHGVVLYDSKTGKEQILINNELSLKDSNVNVGAHEFLHTVLRNTVQNSKGTAIALGKSLQTYIEGIDSTQIDSNSDYGKRLAAYKNDPANIKGEEAITLFSDGIANGSIKFNEGVFTKIGDAIRRTLQAAGIKNVKFNTGRDVYNFVKDYNKSIEKGKGLNKAQQALLDGRAEGDLVKREYKSKPKTDSSVDMGLETEVDLGVVKSSKPTVLEAINETVPQDISTKADYDAMLRDPKKGSTVLNSVINEGGAINNYIRSRSTSKAEAEKAIEGVTDRILNFNPEALRADGKKVGMEGFGEAIFANTRFAKMDAKKALAKESEKAKQEQSTDSDIVREIANAPTSSTSTEKQTAKAQSPRATNQFTPSFSQGLQVETEGKTTAEVNEEINQQFDKAIDSDLQALGEVTSFGQTKNIGPAVAALMEKATGMPAKVFTDKSKNIAKKDATSGALTNVKQYLNKNAQRDFKNLPDAFAKDSGKATFIPENVKKALYKKNDKGQFVLDKSKTLKDYKELLGDMEKPVYRAAEAQTIKGLVALSLRNMIFEKAVPSSTARATTGVKFSKQIPVDTDKGKTQLKDIGVARDMNKVAEISGIGKIGITPENIAEKRAQMTSSIVDQNISSIAFNNGKFANFGRSYKVRDGIKYFKLTNGKEVKNGSKEYKQAVKDETFMPAKGSLYYSVKQKAYIADQELAAANDAMYPNLPKAQRVNVKDAGTKKANAQSKANLDILEAVATQLETAVANGMPIEIASLFITSSYQATTGLIKISAPFSAESDKMEYAEVGKSNQVGGKEAFREEHSPPASVIGGSLIWAIKNGQVKQVMQGIRDNYIQVKLSKKDDVKLDNAKLDSTLPDGVSIMTPNAGIRRFAAAGVNLNTITDYKSGKSFADIMGVGVDLKASKRNPNIIYAQNALINEQIKGDLEVDVTMDKAAIKKFDPHGMIEVVSNRLFGEANYFKLNDTQKAAVQKEMITKNIAKLTQARIKAYEPIASLELKASKINTKTYNNKVSPEMTIAEQLTILGNYDTAARKARSLDTPKKGISVFDFDDTLARTKEKVIVNKPGEVSVEISAAKFAETASQLESEGATFDFSNFEGVANGTKKGPLADLALRRQEKFGNKDIFVLTARPQVSDKAIKTFLDGIGLNLPIGNITGLGNGTPGAKGNWVAQKAAEGYNDFYFADDAYKNVEAVQEVLSQVDVDSEVQIAKFSKVKTFDKIFNDIIESSTGIETFKEYSKAKGQMTGKKKGRFSFLTSPSAEDFLGLLYKTLGKGKIGDAQLDFYKKNLIDTYDRAELAVTKAKIQAANDFKALKKNLKTLPKSLSKEMGYGGFTFSQAARVAAWTRQGLNVPGLSKTDLKALNSFIDNNAEMNTFVDELIKIQKGKPYPAPSKDWLGGTITSDILNDINKVNRKQYLQEWQENVDIIFSEKNMNKLEAAYGPKYVEALRDTLRRMKSGSNRPIGGSRVVNQLLDWLNNSVGAIMFLNTRSAVLQTLSAVNFIGVGNNGIINSAKAFANQKQYWSDFKTLMNSPYLTERRNGLKINVSESEIADAVAESSNKPKAALSFLLNKGFVLTRFADSFAIATGGAAFYRNQLNMYVEQGMPMDMAQKKAFQDFYTIAEKNQQSSNPSKISQQQASGAGRVVLAFANTPMQYARIIKRSSQDLLNGRGDWKKHVGTIAFYGVAQNLIFSALQNALFSEAFGEDEEEDEQQEDKAGRIANGMADSLLSGLGIQGKAVLSLKNALITLAKENDKKSPKFVKAVYDLFDFSPPLDSKFRKLRSAANTFTWERKTMKEKGFSLDNPAYLAGAQVVSGLTNLPLDRAISKLNNIRGIMSEQSEKWQKVALALGWSTWDVGLGYYGGFDPVKPLTEQEQYEVDVTTMKKDTSTKQQKQMLLDLGLTKAEIKKLRYEEDRVKKIIALQKKKNDKK